MTATATAETLTGIDAIAHMIDAVREQQALVEYEQSVLASRRAMLLTLVQETGESKVRTDAGTVSVCAGRRTVRVTCKALAAEIKLMQERAVRTGRAVANIGDPYVMIRR